MESTDPGTVENYPGSWLKFRKDRSVKSDAIYIFSDGSSSGWHGAVIIDPGKTIRYRSSFEETPNRNINAEFNGAILGLEAIVPNSKINLIHDLLGLGAWIIGAWKINKPAVKQKTDQIKNIIKDKNLDVSWVHHAGHQNKKKGERPICNSQFTHYNCQADQLCGSKMSQDYIVNILKEVTNG